MTELGKDDPEYADRIATHADTHRSAWGATLEDMQALADELEADGWHVVTLAADHTAPEHPDAGDTDRFGLVHVVPSNRGEEFSEAFERGEFSRAKVYKQDVDGREFVLTQYMDPETETAILIAGTYEMRIAPALVKAAQREGEMYTHVQKLDKTVLGTFRHEDYTQFFPEPEKYENYVVEANVGVSDDEDGA